MILLDNEIYVTKACNYFSINPHSRLIPISITCLTGESLAVTSALNFAVGLVSIFIIFRAFHFKTRESILCTGLLSLNSLYAFPVFYAAAHSYTYTLFACAISLYVATNKCSKIHYDLICFSLCGILLSNVRSEAPLYFGMSCISLIIFQYIKSVSIRVFFQENIFIFKRIVCVLFSYLIVHKALITFLNLSVHMTNSIEDPSYGSQFPRDSFYAVAISASLDYILGFFLPYKLSFYGNYLDWLDIHQSLNRQYLLNGFFTIISTLSIFFIFKKKKNIFSYSIIALSIMLIPTFLISSFLRNQWYYPSRALIGCFISFPFWYLAFQDINKEKLRKALYFFLMIFFTISFGAHLLFHYNDAQSMYSYETKISKIEHPTVTKVYAQQLLKEKKYLEAAKVLREIGRLFPEKGIFLSANHFFLWSENLYWSAAASFFYQSPLTEQKVLDQLYKNPNFFGALACLQDKRIDIDECLTPKFLKHLCEPTYKKRFGYTYYKKPRIKAQIACSKVK